MQSILIVDDLESIHEMLEAVIQPIGYNTTFAISGEQALQKLQKETFDVVLTDINMEPMDGLELLSQIKEKDPDAVVVMMSGVATVENASAALKRGAFDFLTKPFKVDQLVKSVTRAVDERKKRRDLQSGVATDVATILTGNSSAAKKLNESIERHSKTKGPLLITGETGTQKASIASIIHNQSESADGPFTTIDALKLDDDEFYAALYTPDGKASETIVSAQAGTLFIANIDRVTPKNQSNLGNLIRDIKGETRVICSSGQDLESLVEKGEFEDALFFRVATNTIEVPRLSERSEDLPAIIMSFLGKSGLSHVQLGEQASSLLQAYQWPGNYAELKEVLIASAEAGGDDNIIHHSNLPEKISDTTHWPTLQQFLDAQTVRYRSQVLKACQGDDDKAAQILGE